MTGLEMSKRPKILTVDDRVENLDALEMLLADLDIEFVRATSGNEALKKILEHDFAIALIDVQMPVMDGFETVELMRLEKRSKDLPVIFVSAIHKDEFYRIKGIKTGAVDFIAKPIVPEILIGKVQIFLNLHKNRELLLAEIDRRKESEEALLASERSLRESEERLRTMLNATEAGIMVIDPESHRIVEANPAALKMMGSNRDEILGSVCYSFICPAEEGKCPVTDLGQQVDRSERLLLRANGEPIPILKTVAQVIFDGRPHLLESFVDISDLKRAESEAIQKSKLLDGINRVLLEAMICETEEDLAMACLGVAEGLTESGFGFINEINQDGRVDNLALSSLGWEACEMPQEQARRLLSNMEIGSYWGRILRSGVAQFINDPDKDPDRLGTPPGHSPITRFLGVPLKYSGETIGIIGLANKQADYDGEDLQAVEALSVAFVEAIYRKRSELELDHHREHLEKLVEDRTAELSKQGQDLALSNAELETANRRIMEQQQSLIEEERLKVLLQMAGATAHELNQPLMVLLGNIEILDMVADKPEQRKACMVAIEMAGKKIAETVKKIQHIRHYDTKPYAGGSLIIDLEQQVRILSVEDSDEDFETLRGILKELGQTTCTRAVKLGEAVEILRQEKFDLVLFDYELPDGNALDFMEVLRQNDWELPVVIITGKGNEVIASQIIREGAYDYLPKTRLTRGSLARSITNTLEKARLKRELRKVQERLTDMAIEDELTELYNRRYFLEALEQEILRDRRYEHGLVLCMIDLDHFKNVNDAYGHLTGDMVLRELGRMIRECFRESDIPCRYGGEEFAVILPNTRVEAGRVACERLREAVANHLFSGDAFSFGITISAGLVEHAGASGESAEDLIRRADEALYRAKREGRNRVVALGNCTD